MIDTKAKRAAALGYGLSFLLILPPADGSLDIPDAGHALSAYRYDMPAAIPTPDRLILTGLRMVGPAVSGIRVGGPTASDVRVRGSFASEVKVKC